MTLKPCPFCGSESVVTDIGGDRGYVVSCISCDTVGPRGRTYADAEAKWNRRPGEDAAYREGGDDAALDCRANEGRSDAIGPYSDG